MCLVFSFRHCGDVIKAAGYVKDLDTELYIYPTVALSMKHSLWPSVLSDMTTVCTKKLTADLWLRHKCTKSSGLYQRLSHWTCMYNLIRALYLDSDWCLGKWYMKQKAERIYSLIQMTPKDRISGPECTLSPQSVSVQKPFLMRFCCYYKRSLESVRISSWSQCFQGYQLQQRFSLYLRRGQVTEPWMKSGHTWIRYCLINHYNGPWQILSTLWFSVIHKRK